GVSSATASRYHGRSRVCARDKLSRPHRSARATPSIPRARSAAHSFTCSVTLVSARPVPPKFRLAKSWRIMQTRTGSPPIAALAYEGPDAFVVAVERERADELRTDDRHCLRLSRLRLEADAIERGTEGFAHVRAEQRMRGVALERVVDQIEIAEERGEDVRIG